MESGIPKPPNVQSTSVQFANQRGLAIVFNEDDYDVNDYSYAIGDRYEVDICFLF